MAVNKVILVGNLGRDPEMRHTQNGRPVGNFTLATNERWRDKDGQQQERTEWHRIVVWDRLAEICTEYLTKGKQIYIEGRLQTRQWEDREGNKRSTTEIVANQMQMLGRRGEPGPGDPGPGDPGPGESSPEPEAAPPGPAGDDDIPF